MMIHGTVMKITEQFIVVLCEDGKFMNVPHQPVMPRLGDRISIDSSQQSSPRKRKQWMFKKNWVIAASIFLIIGLSFILKLVYGPIQSVALVAIDINPSIELVVDKKGNVEKVNLVNDDAELMISEKELQGMEFYQAAQLIFSKAEEQGYLDLTTEKKRIWVSVVNYGRAEFQVELQKMNMEDKKYEVELYTANEQQIEHAKAVALSLNKFVVYELAKENGLELDIEQLRTNSIATTLKDAGVDSGQLFAHEAESANEKQVPDNKDKQTTDRVATPQIDKSDQHKGKQTSDIKDKNEQKVEKDERKKQKQDKKAKKEKERDNGKEKNKNKERYHKWDKGKEKESNKDKEKASEKDRKRENTRANDKDHDWGKSRKNDKDHDKDIKRETEKGKVKEKDRDKKRGKDTEKERKSVKFKDESK